MKRSLFLIITAIAATLFGCMMLFMSDKAAESFGMTSSPEIALMFRSLGGLVLATGILNFMVRNHSDTSSLKAVLIFNIVFHVISTTNDFVGLSQGILDLNKMIPGMIVHFFIIIGSFIYAQRISVSN